MESRHRLLRRRVLALLGLAMAGGAGCAGAPENESETATATSSDGTAQPGSGAQQSGGGPNGGGNAGRQNGSGSGGQQGGGNRTPPGTMTPGPYADLGGPIPAVEATGTALNGQQRNPDAIQPKTAFDYQSQPKDGDQCSTCQFYVPDESGDGLGACVLVGGKIEPDAWCTSYVSTDST
jgi:hypothetical protein